MTPTKTRPHKPMLAEWSSEILSLSLSRVVPVLVCCWAQILSRLVHPSLTEMITMFATQGEFASIAADSSAEAENLVKSRGMSSKHV